MRPTAALHPFAIVALAVLLGTLPATAHGADLHAFVGADTGGPRGRVLVADLRMADPRLADDRFDVGFARTEAAASAALGWRRTAVAGPVGNLVLEGAIGAGRAASGPAATDGARAGVELGARGVAGPVALAVRAAYGNRVPFIWPELSVDAPAAPPAEPRARTTAGADEPIVAARFRATWRIDRSWTLSAAPTVVRTASDWTGSLEAALRRYGLGDDLDLSVRIDAAAGASAGHAALGATLHHAPRRAPESSATIWWGAAWSGAANAIAAPGAEVAWQVRSGATEASLAAGWAPFWSDRPVGYAALRASAPMATGRGRLEVAWTGTTWLAELGWSRALPR
ncbi:MAG: hypothetical protein ABR510_00940 [Trueperaceae bacterium]